jgi:hypothetical protein
MFATFRSRPSVQDLPFKTRRSSANELFVRIKKSRAVDDEAVSGSHGTGFKALHRSADAREFVDGPENGN